MNLLLVKAELSELFILARIKIMSFHALGLEYLDLVSSYLIPGMFLE